MTVSRYEGNEIAIIGMAGRYPQAPTLDVFWQKLRAGKELIRFFSAEELRAAGVEEAIWRAPNFTPAAAYLDEMADFDAAFFNMLPREAQITDPQHRLLLECAWETLEDAGYDPTRYNGLIGVYVGAVMNTYLLFNLMANPELAAGGLLPIQFANGRDYLPTRISYKLGLRGPSCLIQSACSTSLVAVHTACQALLNGECDIALAGGVSVLVNQRWGYPYMEGSVMSPDGHCRAFDAQAAGTIFGSGAGMVALKPLEQALADRDRIVAVIRGSAVNNDGANKASYTAPGVSGQTEVIIEALANANVTADSIQYIEAHGTGTTLGDAIEIQALSNAFRQHTDRRQFCAVGSVKSNVGHLDAAAGITGLIKTALALQHRCLPPSLHVTQPNPKTPWEQTPFYVNTQLCDWPPGEPAEPAAPRRAGVSSFGIGGTNAHVILEEAPPPDDPAEPPGEPAEPRTVHLLVLSARTPTALSQMTDRLAEHLTHNPATDLADVALTLQLGRAEFSQRTYVVADNLTNAIEKLRAGPPLWAARPESLSNRPVAFLFPGQGAAYPQMGAGLYATEPVFRDQLDRCAEGLRPWLGLDIRDVLYGGEAGDLHATHLTQPSLFAVEYALARLWQSWGVHPQAMLGHSLGEYTAACLAGVFSLEDGLRLTARRGALMQALPPGQMLAAALEPETARAYLTPALSLAAINAPDRCVIAGPAADVAALARRWQAEGIRCQILPVTRAFHSAYMEPALEAFSAEVRQTRLQPPQIPFVSNLTGRWITPQEATDPHYWTQHLRHTVQFAAGLAELQRQAGVILVEIGPGETLSRLAQRQPAGAALTLATLHQTENPREEAAWLVQSAGWLWAHGGRLDWEAFSRGYGRRVALPTYPFERQRYWIELQSRLRGQGDKVAPVSRAPVSAETVAAPPPQPQAIDNRAGALPQIINQQLKIMAQQLQVLRQRQSQGDR